MAIYAEGVQTYAAMFEGFAGAASRFLEVAQDDSELSAYIALFEALNWVVALDQRTAEIWAPDGEVLGWEWRNRVEGARMLRGVRFARNSMHHDWAAVLELSPVGAGVPDTASATNRQWVWRAVGDLPPRGQPEPEAESIYIDELAGGLVRSTLVGLYQGFDLLRSLLEPAALRG